MRPMTPMRISIPMAIEYLSRHLYLVDSERAIPVPRGRGYLEKQQAKTGNGLDEDDVENLSFLRQVAKSWPLRELKVHSTRRKPWVLYTDASFEEESGNPPKLGWVLFGGAQTQGRSCQLSWNLVERWIQRRQNIFPAETVVPLAALRVHEEELRGQDVIIFVDNEAAASSLIRGSSGCQDGRSFGSSEASAEIQAQGQGA